MSGPPEWFKETRIEAGGVIPLVYKLRKGVSFEKVGNSWTVVSRVPLTILRVSERASRLLRASEPGLTVTQIADGSGVSDEEAYKLCEYFNWRALLEISPALSGDYFPAVSVIIPAKDRREEIAECLESVFTQDYPRNRVEVIVIDDGSSDGTGNVAAGYGATLLTNSDSLGQSYCRNLGVRNAGGEILAFLDSDCVAGETWLRELVTYFQWSRVGAVGGLVDGYYEQSLLDRYEKTFSSLNMGRYIRCAADSYSTLYVPTCNLLVRKQVFDKAGGMRESMRVGEDVDFCWRLRKAGHNVLYVPKGAVKHKHRSHLTQMLKRRAEYGTSESLLYELHPDKKKMFQIPILTAMEFVMILSATLFQSILPLVGAAVSFVCDIASKALRIRKLNIRVPLTTLLFSIVRGHLSFTYYVSFHLIRYYFILLFLLGLLFHPLWVACMVMLLVASIVDWTVKGPRLSFPVFLCIYGLEHLSYQVGVLAGCIRRRSFGSYVPRFFRRIGDAL